MDPDGLDMDHKTLPQVVSKKLCRGAEKPLHGAIPKFIICPLHGATAVSCLFMGPEKQEELKEVQEVEVPGAEASQSRTDEGALEPAAVEPTKPSGESGAQQNLGWNVVGLLAPFVWFTMD
eukprot:s1114_g1.t1